MPSSSTEKMWLGGNQQDRSSRARAKREWYTGRMPEGMPPSAPSWSLSVLCSPQTVPGLFGTLSYDTVPPLLTHTPGLPLPSGEKPLTIFSGLSPPLPRVSLSPVLFT